MLDDRPCFIARSATRKKKSPGTCRLFLFVFLLLCCVLGWFLFCVFSSCFASACPDDRQCFIARSAMRKKRSATDEILELQFVWLLIFNGSATDKIWFSRFKTCGLCWVCHEMNSSLSSLWALLGLLQTKLFWNFRL